MKKIKRTTAIKRLTALKRPTALLLVSAIAITLSGCAGFDLSLDSMLSPPKLSDEEAEIYQALLNVRGENVDLSYPESGEYRSAFTIYDFDNEPTEEAMVFYKATSATGAGESLRLNFLDQQDGKWASVVDIPASGQAVKFIRLERLSGSNRLCIMISYSALGQSESLLDILEYSEGQVSTLFSGRFTYLEFKDFNADGMGDLFLISREPELNYYNASMVGWNGEALETITKVPLTPEAVSFQQTVVFPISSNETAVLIDYGKSDTAYGTEILYCYENNFTSSNFSPDALGRRVNNFTPNLLCSDIDGDGTVEIPVTTPFLGYENLTKPEQIQMVLWYVLQDKALVKKYSTYCGTREDFMVKLPSRWIGMVTVQITGDELRFIEYKDNGETLLTLKAAAPDAKVTEGWELYYENERTGYQYFIIKGGENSMCLTDAELEDCLVFFP